ncbi:MAG: DUF2769 domain-containing protein [Candidatus Aminicenantales bacterium]
MEMNPEEMKKMEEKVIGMCICRACPTYVAGADPIGYCFPTKGKNERIQEEDQCICPGCPIYEEISLTKTFFCTRGSEKEQKES